jgi:hypothetical protein
MRFILLFIVLTALFALNSTAQSGYLSNRNPTHHSVVKTNYFYVSNCYKYTLKKKKSDGITYFDTIKTYVSNAMFALSDQQGAQPVSFFNSYDVLCKNSENNAVWISVRNNKDKRYGVIDLTTGKTIVPIEYERIRFIEKDQAIMAIGDKASRLFDLSGNQLNTVTYKNLVRTTNGYYDAVQTGSNAIIYDRNNVKLLEFPNSFLMDEIDTTSYIVKRNGKFGIVNQRNETRLDFEFDQLYLNPDLEIIAEKTVNKVKLQTSVKRNEKGDFEVFKTCQYRYIKDISGTQLSSGQEVAYYVIDQSGQSHLIDETGKAIVTLEIPINRPVYATSVVNETDYIKVHYDYEDRVYLFRHDGSQLFNIPYSYILSTWKDYVIFQDDYYDQSYLLHFPSGNIITTVSYAYEIITFGKIAIVDGSDGSYVYTYDEAKETLGKAIINTDAYYLENALGDDFKVMHYINEYSKYGSVLINPTSGSYVQLPFQAHEIYLSFNTMLAVGYDQSALIEIDYQQQTFGKELMVKNLFDLAYDDVNAHNLINILYGTKKKLNNLIYHTIKNEIILEAPYAYNNYHYLALRIANDLNEWAKFITPFNQAIDAPFKATRVPGKQEYIYINTQNDTLKNFISNYLIEFVPINLGNNEPFYEARVTFMGYDYELMYVSAIFDKRFNMIQPFKAGIILNLYTTTKGYVVQRQISESRTSISTTYNDMLLDEALLTQKLGIKKPLSGYNIMVVDGGIVVETVSKNYILDYAGNLLISGAGIYPESMSEIHAVYCDNADCKLVLSPSKKTIEFYSFTQPFAPYFIVAVTTEEGKLAFYDTSTGDLIMECNAKNIYDSAKVSKDRIVLVDHQDKLAVFNLATKRLEKEFTMTLEEVHQYLEGL